MTLVVGRRKRDALLMLDLEGELQSPRGTPCQGVRENPSVARISPDITLENVLMATQGARLAAFGSLMRRGPCLRNVI